MYWVLIQRTSIGNSFEEQNQITWRIPPTLDGQPLYSHMPDQEMLCWGFTAQSTQWGHVERGQFT